MRRSPSEYADTGCPSSFDRIGGNPWAEYHSRMTEPTIELTGIYIYPVKSLRGVSLRDAALENGRLVGDRTWLLVDSIGQFMHQRDYPQMTRVSAIITDRGITVATMGIPTLAFDRPGPSDTTGDAVTHVRLWRRSAPVTLVSPEADAWCNRGARRLVPASPWRSFPMRRR